MPTVKLVKQTGFTQTEYNGVTTSAGSSNAGDYPVLGTNGTLDQSMMPSGVGPTVVTCNASAAISAGALVNFWYNAGVLNARPADNTSAGSEANGYAPSAVSSGASGQFYLSGIIAGLSGLTPGTQYGLGTVGAVTATAPSTAGNVIQSVGKAISTTTLEFLPGPVVIAA